MEKDNMSGMMEEDVQVNGRITSSMGMLRYSMKMVGHIKEISIKIKSMAMVFTSGLMGRSTMEIGRTASSMEKEALSQPLVTSKQASGIMDNEQSKLE